MMFRHTLRHREILKNLQSKNGFTLGSTEPELVRATLLQELGRDFVEQRGSDESTSRMAVGACGAVCDDWPSAFGFRGREASVGVDCHCVRASCTRGLLFSQRRSGVLRKRQRLAKGENFHPSQLPLMAVCSTEVREDG